MKTVMAMAPSGDRQPYPAAFRGEHASDIIELCLLDERRRRARCRPRRTARPRLGWRRRLDGGEMIAGRVESASAVAVGRIAQPHAEHGLELVIACPNAPVVEAQ